MNTKKNKKSKNPIDTSTEVVIDSNGQIEVLSMKPSAELLDMKLTRTELIELITSEIEEDLHIQLNKCIKEYEEVDSKIHKYGKNMSDEAFFEEVFANIREQNKDWKRHVGGLYNGTLSANLSLSIPIPEGLLTRLKELGFQCEELRAKLRKLQAKEGKSAIMKQMLGASEAGKNLLEQIKGFNKGVTANLLTK